MTLKGGVSKTGTTDAQGRVQFDNVAPGTSVTAEANVQGELLTSQPITIPGSGGVRVALVAGVANAAAAEKAAAEAAAKSRRVAASSNSAASRESSSNTRMTA